MKMKKLLPFLIVFLILFLTLQSPQETTRLSGAVQKWLKSIGINIQSVTLRHLAHIPLYLILGITLAIAFRSRFIFIPAILIALGDELLKVLLPTREFDLLDLTLDIASMALGILLVRLVQNRRVKAQE